mmetsp:Transcript_23536/g.44408  ORF Transcript_23536/g.44408 Transcript_23536/m.44408 type:complete len:271 (+) Transcript_23536:96-908(+)
MPIPIAELDAKQPWAVPLVPDDTRDQHGNTRDQHVKSLVLNLWHSREDGDFEFHVAGGTLRAHGCILSAASPVFKAMLASGMTERLTSSMNVDAEHSELLVVLRFIYTGELDATAQQLPGVLALAHKYEVLSLIPLVCEAMIANLNIDTVVPYIRVLRLLEGSDFRKLEPSSNDTSPTNVQAWMNLPATGSPPSIPPAVRVTGSGLSQPPLSSEVLLGKDLIAGATLPVSPPPGDDHKLEAAPSIHQAFVAVAQKIASCPELLMQTLRAL